MRAMVVDGYGDADRLRLDERPDPVPGPGELLVNVRAASVNPVDWKIRRGDLKLILHLGFPYIPGGDIAGEVAAVGPGVTPTVSHTFPLEQAAEAHRLSEQGHVRGKIVLEVSFLSVVRSPFLVLCS